MDHFQRNALAGYAEILQAALRLRAPEPVGGNFDVAEGISFDSGFHGYTLNLIGHRGHRDHRGNQKLMFIRASGKTTPARADFYEKVSQFPSRCWIVLLCVLCVLCGKRVYQGIGFLSRKNPPVGPLSGSIASQTAVCAPFSTLRLAVGPPISVRTQPGQIELTRIFSSAVAVATMRVSALSMVFDVR